MLAHHYLHRTWVATTSNHHYATIWPIMMGVMRCYHLASNTRTNILGRTNDALPQHMAAKLLLLGQLINQQHWVILVHIYLLQNNATLALYFLGGK